MRSPFPGMDPWLEFHWRDVHARLIIYIADQLQRHSKQRLFLSGGVNLVEIDLVRAGEWAFSIDERVMPARQRTPYMICVFRATRPGERAAYPLPLRVGLPSIAIPLRPTDRDVALDLQAVVDEAYEKGRYDRTDYRRPLAPPLPPADAEWATDILRTAGRV